MTGEWRDLAAEVVGLPVSHVWHGAGTTLFLELGELRSNGRNNPRGERTLHMGGTWRVQTRRSIRFGSSSAPRHLYEGVGDLRGRLVSALALVDRLPELQVSFGAVAIRSFALLGSQPEWFILDSVGSHEVIRGRVSVRNRTTGTTLTTQSVSDDSSTSRELEGFDGLGACLVGGTISEVAILGDGRARLTLSSGRSRSRVCLGWEWRVETSRAVKFSSWSGRPQLRLDGLVGLVVEDARVVGAVPELQLAIGRYWMRTCMLAEGQPSWSVESHSAQWEVRRGRIVQVGS